MQTYKVEFTEQEVNVLTELLNIAVMSQGMKNNTDQNARYFLAKIEAGVVEAPKNETPVS